MAGVYGPLLARKTEYHVSGERACKVGDTERIEYFIGKRVRIMSGWSVVEGPQDEGLGLRPQAGLRGWPQG